jgi:hypothetical protein
MSRRHLDDHWVHELAGTTPPKPSSTTAAHLDRRQSERVSLGAKVRYMSEAPESVEVEAQLLDISKKGCRIDTGSVLEVGTRIRLILQLNDGQEPLSLVSAMVCWNDAHATLGEQSDYTAFRLA